MLAPIRLVDADPGQSGPGEVAPKVASPGFSLPVLSGRSRLQIGSERLLLHQGRREGVLLQGASPGLSLLEMKEPPEAAGSSGTVGLGSSDATTPPQSNAGVQGEGGSGRDQGENRATIVGSLKSSSAATSRKSSNESQRVGCVPVSIL